MATEKEKTEIRKLAKKGKSVNHITQKTGIPKSTVYYHFKKEVGQKQKENQLKIPENPEVQGEICGTFSGDGNYYKDKNYKYRIKFTLNINQNYWKKLAEFLEENLEKKPHINHQRKYNRTNLRYESKTLLEFLQTHLHWEKTRQNRHNLPSKQELLKTVQNRIPERPLRHRRTKRKNQLHVWFQYYQ